MSTLRDLARGFFSPLAAAVASQLGHPHGWFGRTVMTRLLDRANASLITAALDELPLSGSTRLLDVGFGGGASLRIARTRGVMHLFGLDPSDAAVAKLLATRDSWIRGATLEVERGAVESMPYADRAFDAIVTTNTVYFWPDLAAAFRELFRVLAPGGTLAVGFAGEASLRRMDAITRHGFVVRAESEVVGAAKSAGFTESRLVPLRGRQTDGRFVLVLTKPG